MKNKILKQTSSLKKSPQHFFSFPPCLFSLGAGLLVSLLCPFVQANTVGEITEVRRNITLANDETPVKDFYIKISDGSAIKKNMILKAVRKLEAKDLGQKKVGDFSSTVGLLKVLYVEGNVAIAREHQKVPRTDQPMLEQIGIMMGDTVEPFENSGGNKKDTTSAALTGANKKSTVAKKSVKSANVASKQPTKANRSLASVANPADDPAATTMNPSVNSADVKPAAQRAPASVSVSAATTTVQSAEIQYNCSCPEPSTVKK